MKMKAGDLVTKSYEDFEFRFRVPGATDGMVLLAEISNIVLPVIGAAKEADLKELNQSKNENGELSEMALFTMLGKAAQIVDMVDLVKMVQKLCTMCEYRPVNEQGTPIFEPVIFDAVFNGDLPRALGVAFWVGKSVAVAHSRGDKLLGLVQQVKSR